MNNFNPCHHAPGHGCRHYPPMPPYCGFAWNDCPYLMPNCQCNNSGNQNASQCHEQEGDCIVNNDLTVGGDFTLNGNAHIKGNLTVDGSIINSTQNSGESVLPEDPNGANQGEIPDSGSQSVTDGGQNNGSVIVDTVLNIASDNAISNNAVTAAIQNLQNQIYEIPAGTGQSGDVNVDNVTIANQSGVLRIADNEKDSDNAVGDVQVTGTTFPSVPAENTRYNIYKNVSIGNTSGGSAITLPAGSKIVPKGGMPMIPVSGGEISWVHSSDIGMVQDDTSLTSSQRLERGAQNAAILRYFVQCPYHLILDGTYVIDIPENSNVAHVDAGIRLERPLEIQGGKLIMTNYLFSMGPGSAIKATDVEFVHWRVNNYDRTAAFPMFMFDCRSNLIGHFIMQNCKFSGGGHYTDHIADNLLSTQSQREVNKWWYYAPNLSFMEYGCSYFDTSSSTVPAWFFPVGYTNRSGTVRDYNGNTVSSSDYDNHCLYKANAFSPIFVADSNTDFWANNVKDTTATYWFAPTSTTNVFSGDVYYNGAWGKFLEVDGSTPAGAETYHKAYVSRGAEWQGIGRFVLSGCNVDGGDFQFGDCAVKDEFTIDHCVFTNIRIAAVSFGSNNLFETSGDWTYRSCPLYITDNIFSGPQTVVTDTSDAYHCALLAETEEVHFRNNTVRDMISASAATNCYDTYLSCHRLFYENNTVINVFAAPRIASASNRFSKKLAEWGKSKGIGGTIDWQADYTLGVRYDEVVRVFRHNRFEIDCAQAWEICRSYFETTYTAEGDVPYEIFRHYALTVKVIAYTTGIAFDRVVWEYNTLRIPQGYLHGNVVSSFNNYIREFSFCHNDLDFYGYSSIPYNKLYNSTSGAYSKYLFIVKPAEVGQGETRINIDGNTFRSRSDDLILLLCTKSDTLVKHLSIKDNKFENCRFRVTGHTTHYSTTQNFCGDVNSENLVISGNECRGVVDNGITGWEYTYGEASNAYRGLVKCDYTYTWTTESHDIEIYDTQNPGVPATSAKGIKVMPTTDGGRAAFRCRHICRPVTITDGAIIDNTTSTPQVRDVSLKFATIFRSDTVGESRTEAWNIFIRYRKNGLDCRKKMELKATTNRTGSSASNSMIVLRDTEGVRHGGYGNALQNRVDDTIACAPEIGLYAHLKYTPHQTGIYGPRIELSFYTDANGTTNDFGSDILIEMIETTNPETVNTSTLLVDYDNPVTPIESFIPKGSIMPSTWTTKTNILTNGTTTVDDQPILSPSDAGFWIIDPTTHNMKIWNGTSWQTLSQSNIQQTPTT